MKNFLLVVRLPNNQQKFAYFVKFFKFYEDIVLRRTLNELLLFSDIIMFMMC